MGEYTSSGTLTARYLHGTGPDEPLAQIAGTRRWFLAGTQGSIIAETDTAGARVGNAMTYDPYGQPASWTGPRFGYTGQMVLLGSSSPHDREERWTAYATSGTGRHFAVPP